MSLGRTQKKSLDKELLNEIKSYKNKNIQSMTDELKKIQISSKNIIKGSDLAVKRSIELRKKWEREAHPDNAEDKESKSLPKSLVPPP